MGIAVKRVDRVEHNDDIDDRIVHLTNQADICIADLTYARPSVYYEAGFVTGQGKSVIYIARRDHFRARDDDPDGNRRVHFDLQMKNIIPWTEPDDLFRKRLNRRVSLVLAPLARKNREQRKAKEIELVAAKKEEEFSLLSLNQQLYKIRDAAAASLRPRGFAEKRTTSEDHHRTSRLLSVSRTKKHEFQRIDILPMERFSRTQVGSPWMWDFLRPSGDRPFSSATLLVVIASLRFSNPTTLRSTFSSFTSVRPYLLKKTGEASYFRRQKGKNVALEFRKPATTYIALISGITSARHFRNDLKSVLTELGLL